MFQIKTLKILNTSAKTAVKKLYMPKYFYLIYKLFSKVEILIRWWQKIFFYLNNYKIHKK